MHTLPHRIKSWFEDRENILFLILIVFCLVPIWAFQYFPSQDGPCHLEIANVIRNYNNPAYPIFRQYYDVNIKNFTTNVLAEIVLALLMYVAPFLIAEKIFLSAYIILFPISIRYVLCAINPKSKFLAILSFIFLYNYPLHMGFYDFIAGLPLAFFLIGYWIKHIETLNVRDMSVMGLLSILCSLAHPFSVLIAYITIGVTTIYLMLYNLTIHSSTESGAFGKYFKTYVIMPFMAFLPTLLLLATSSLNKEKFIAGPHLPARVLWNQLCHPTAIVSYDQPEAVYAGYVFAFIILIALYNIADRILKRRLKPLDGLLSVVILYCIIYFTVPSFYTSNHRWGGLAFILERINLSIFLTLIIWFGISSYNRTFKHVIQFFGAGFVVLLVGLYMGKYADLNIYLKEYMSSAKFIKPNTTVLPLTFSSRGFAPNGKPLSLKVGPFEHTAGYIAVQDDAVNLYNHLSFPVNYYTTLHPYVYLGVVNNPTKINIMRYNKIPDAGIDYVLIWTGPQSYDIPPASFLFEALESYYTLIYTSPNNFLTLYRRKNI